MTVTSFIIDPMNLTRTKTHQRHEANILASSNPANGAVNLSADGSSFQIQLTDPLSIPENAENVTLSVEETTIWFTTPNIITGVNDKMFITGPDTVDVIQNFNVTIPQGLYGLSELNNAILRELENAGAKVSPDPIVSFTADDATSKVILRVNYLDTSVDFSLAQTPREIMGFDSLVYGPYNPVPQNILAPNIATFNQINSFYVLTDLTGKGIRLNNNYGQIMAQIPITAAPGSQIVYTPFNPPRIDANELKGSLRTNIRCWLTDDQRRLVNTGGEYWSFRIVVRYSVFE